MIVILDYGMGNVASMSNMLRKVGGETIVSASEDQIEKADAIILPGVGAFDNGMIKLKQSGLLALVEKRVIQEKIPFLGVCLGMQLLFNSSDEGTEAGLGWLKGSVKRFDFSNITNSNRLKIPHMGWNYIKQRDDPLFEGFENDARFYFVHSYHVNCDIEHDIIASSVYGNEFTCAVKYENIYGVQFHPEKSHKYGEKLFKNYLNIIKSSVVSG